VVYVAATFIFCVIAFICLNVCTKMTVCESRITDLLRLSRMDLSYSFRKVDYVVIKVFK